jgi:hypothetical protein
MTWDRYRSLPVVAAEDFVFALANREPPKGVQLLDQVAALHQLDDVHIRVYTVKWRRSNFRGIGFRPSRELSLQNTDVCAG